MTFQNPDNLSLEDAQSLLAEWVKQGASPLVRDDKDSDQLVIHRRESQEPTLAIPKSDLNAALAVQSEIRNGAAAQVLPGHKQYILTTGSGNPWATVVPNGKDKSGIEWHV